ncbi:hypothetical protein WH47_03275 [Habropoda laboriosa]|uniref:Uncharacterized protein n=1 Tax=Habropoda laboriosa TaxID=597456 RepID=A0A0L7RB21_9HYME|nr:hypothetical protein WH47_03275 [Habropoda laboriosa]
MKTSLRNGNGHDGVRFDLTVPRSFARSLQPAVFSTNRVSSESATNLADRRTSFQTRFLSQNFHRILRQLDRTTRDRDTTLGFSRFLRTWGKLMYLLLGNSSALRYLPVGSPTAGLSKDASLFTANNIARSLVNTYTCTFLKLRRCPPSKADNERRSGVSTRCCLVIRS